MEMTDIAVDMDSMADALGLTTKQLRSRLEMLGLIKIMDFARADALDRGETLQQAHIIFAAHKLLPNDADDDNSHHS